MSLPTESVTQAGSGLVFVNYYDAGVTEAYRDAVVTAEHQLQSLITNPLTIGVTFDFQPLGRSFSAQNNFSEISVSYATLAQALRAHATTGDDQIAVNGLPSSDPSGGAGFAIPIGQAVALGLQPQTNDVNLTVTLNSSLSWTFGQDAVGALEHEITEGGFGRLASLGLQGDSRWAPLDLFRFTASGQRDYTGGQDGQATYFGLDAAHVSALAYHNSISAAGVDDGFDLGDWDHTVGDAFGPGGPRSPGSISATDAQVLDILGYSSAPYTPPPDEFANSLTDTSHPFGQLVVGGSATGTLQSAGDRDWFAVTLAAGHSYRIDLSGHESGAGTLADPYLRLHDATGALLASDDDIVSGSDPDSEIVFTAPSGGTYYVEAGAFADGYAGSYRVSVSQIAGAQGVADVGGPGDDVLTGAPGGDSIDGVAGNDTITGVDGQNTLHGGDGDDSIVGGPGFNAINGNTGQDTLVGQSHVGDWLLGGQGNDSIDATASTGHNIVNGNLGSDTLHGGSGGDTLHGGQGDDLIVGGAGNDWISGDLGHDTLTGGAGADVFHVASGNTLTVITDFNAGQGDHLLLDAGATWSATASGADTEITLNSGTEILLQNVSPSTLPPGAILIA
jgi:Ca2+-binding RTX toxin-like protein